MPRGLQLPASPRARRLALQRRKRSTDFFFFFLLSATLTVLERRVARLARPFGASDSGRHFCAPPMLAHTPPDCFPSA